MKGNSRSNAASLERPGNNDSMTMLGNPNASILLGGAGGRIEGSVEKILNSKSQFNQKNILDEMKEKTGKSQLIIPKRANPIAPTKAIYCIGDTDQILRYDILSDRWSIMEQRTTSQYKGDLKYSAVCRISSNQLLLTGGCSTRELRASNRVYVIQLDESLNRCEFYVQHSLHEPRYGHCQSYNSGAVYVIGGFDHEDIIGLPPSTLTSCEIYVPQDDLSGTPAQVESIAHLNLPRAYAGCCQIGSLIYVFGGLNGYETLSSIEQYNSGYDTRGAANQAGLNTWTLIYTKMPLKLAKLAAAPIDKNNILIVGGIYGSVNEEGYSEAGYQYVSATYKLDLSQNQPKWYKQPKMIAKRTHYSALPYCPGPSQGQVSFFALGGSSDGSCETITFPTTSTQTYAQAPKWKSIKSYLKDDFASGHYLELNDLQTFCLSN